LYGGFDCSSAIFTASVAERCEQKCAARFRFQIAWIYSTRRSESSRRYFGRVPTAELIAELDELERVEKSEQKKLELEQLVKIKDESKALNE